MCAKVVRSRQRKRAGGRSAADSEGEEEAEGEAGGAAGSPVLRPERVRRWDHLRKIHVVGVCLVCSKYVPRALMDDHRSACTHKAQL